jgi:hypothetical protein
VYESTASAATSPALIEQDRGFVISQGSGAVDAQNPLPEAVLYHGFSNLVAVRSFCCVASLGLFCCATEPPPGAVSDTPARRNTCAKKIDARALLARHAGAFGSAQDIDAALPRTFSLVLEKARTTGTCELILDRTQHRRVCQLGTLAVAEGIDEFGPWSISATGALVRPEGSEASDINFDAWLEGRRYLIDPSSESSCAIEGDRAIAVLKWNLPAVGNSVLAFDLDNGVLLWAKHIRGSGAWMRTDIREWGPADAGVRWPLTKSSERASEEPSLTRLESVKPGLACAAGGDCLAPTGTPFQIAWWGRSKVATVPFEYVQHELLMPAKIGQSTVWATLDSGSQLMWIDSVSPASLFNAHPFAVDGMPSKKGLFGRSEFESIVVGEVVLQRVPVSGAPFPAFSEFGGKRPQLILGYPLFQAAAIRIDYAKGEIVFARDVSLLDISGHTAIALNDVDGEPVADVMLAGHLARLAVDTGDNGSIDLIDSWTTANHLPGEFPFHDELGSNDLPPRRLFRMPNAQLGPITLEQSLVSIRAAAVDRRPELSSIAGRIGNRFLSRCPSVVFDLPHGKLWFEPPCERPFDEYRGNWRLERRNDPLFIDRPWVIEGVFEGGSADRAGIANGDRLLELGGQPATLLNITEINRLCYMPAGTNLPVVIDRRGLRKTVTMTLLDVLKSSP